MVQLGFDALPQFTPPRELPEEAPELAARYPLTLVSSPAHQFLNSSFVNVDSLRRGAREPELVIHPDDAAPRDIVTGMQVRIHNDRGEFLAKARVEDSVRPATVWAPSIWWSKYTVDGKNPNDTTSQMETDLGHGPVFYDNLVEVSPAD
jgi:anaerobic selenocysteine-containing dehydrogenase